VACLKEYLNPVTCTVLQAIVIQDLLRLYQKFNGINKYSGRSGGEA
jgi:hypothetical protein